MDKVVNQEKSGVKVGLEVSSIMLVKIRNTHYGGKCGIIILYRSWLTSWLFDG